MSAKPRSSAAIALLLTGATLMFGCGDSGDDSDTTAEASKQFAAPTEAPADAQEGGSLTVLAASDVDNIDPGATYYQFGYMVTDATQSALVGYAPGDIDARPLLAAEEPTVSDDGKTITYKLRDDVKFSPPVNRTVTSADVKYAIERSLLPGRRQRLRPDLPQGRSSASTTPSSRRRAIQPAARRTSAASPLRTTPPW